MAADAKSSFQQTLQAARDGDKQAQGRLLEKCRPTLLHYARRRCRRMLQSKVSPSDAVQESFLQALREIETFDGCTPEQMMAWLRAIVTNELGILCQEFNTAKRQVRREMPGQTARLESDPNLAVPSAVETALQHEEMERLDEAVERLPDHYKEVVRLHSSENWSFRKIGGKIGRTAEGVRKLWRRALAALNRRLAG